MNNVGEDGEEKSDDEEPYDGLWNLVDEACLMNSLTSGCCDGECTERHNACSDLDQDTASRSAYTSRNSLRICTKNVQFSKQVETQHNSENELTRMIALSYTNEEDEICEETGEECSEPENEKKKKDKMPRWKKPVKKKNKAIATKCDGASIIGCLGDEVNDDRDCIMAMDKVDMKCEEGFKWVKEEAAVGRSIRDRAAIKKALKESS